MSDFDIIDLFFCSCFGLLTLPIDYYLKLYWMGPKILTTLPLPRYQFSMFSCGPFDWL